MTIEEVINELHKQPEETYICARKPWNHGSEVTLVPYAEYLQVRDSLKSDGYEYFLEVSTAKEILEGFLERKPTVRQTTDFVIYYAKFDSFPEWSHQI